ncbi:MAG: plasmid replication initiator TrfA [Mariprofundaceae bacterium]|nr:plasmid replication initiator TrfA [Mariprofundaceae bacterium]
MAFKFEIPEAVKKELAERDAMQEKESKSKADIIRFPNCPPAHQAAPSAILRSALFGVNKRGRREHLENVDIAAWENVKITYTGAKLSQSDQDVWLACVEACSRQKSTTINCSRSFLMKLAGRKVGDTKRMWIDLVRLKSTTLIIDNGKRRYAGSLIASVAEDDESGMVIIDLDSKIFELFGGNVTHIETSTRHALSGDLTKWLHGYVLSHKSTWRKPHWIGLGKLQSLTGSKTTEKRKFRQMLRKSMGKLKAQDVVSGWKLEDDILTLWRP